MELNTEDMPKSMLAVIALAAILSLSLLAQSCLAITGSGDTACGDCDSPPPIGKAPKHDGDHTKPSPRHHTSDNEIKHKVNEINNLFRSGKTTKTTQSDVPVAKLLPFNSTFHDASTPFCWYTVNVPPCFDIVTNSMRP